MNEELDANLKKNSNQKLPSKYRSGKFSSTITNLLLNISAKLHHNKNKAQGEGGSSQPPTPTADNIKFSADKPETVSSTSPSKLKPTNNLDSYTAPIQQQILDNKAVNAQTVSTKFKILSMMGSSKNKIKYYLERYMKPVRLVAPKHHQI